MNIPPILTHLLPVPPLPNTQVLSSPTFSKPALDGTLTLPEIYDWHYHNSPNHPIFIYSDATGSIRTILWSEAVRAIHTAARLVNTVVRERSPSHEENARPIVGILAASDTISFFTLMVGITRADCIAFLISPRNSPAAIAHLLQATGTIHLFVGHEQAIQDLAATSLQTLQVSHAGSSLPTSSFPPLFEELYRSSDEDFEMLPPYRGEMSKVSFILHSSGSTAFPKPIPLTHFGWLNVGFAPYFGQRDLTGKRFSCHALPMFHGMGMTMTSWTASCGLILTTAKPQSPAVPSSQDSVFEGAMRTRSEIIFCAPIFLEAWSKTPERVEQLKKIDGLVYGGGPLNRTVGDVLRQEGVPVFMLYGSTELGMITPALPCEPSFDFDYFETTKQMDARFVPNGFGQFELVVVPSRFHVPNTFNGKLDGQDACFTNDLLSPHPSRPGYWRIYGRSDDQIMHSTGEKTNPGPLESIVNQDPRVQASVMFGRGRFNVGMIIDPSPGHKFDPADQVQLSNFRDIIWPTVQRMNRYAPQQSRLFKEMILTTSPSKPFEYTAKNTPRRLVAIAAYAKEIDDAYRAVEETTRGDVNIPPPVQWSFTSTLLYVRAVVRNVMQKQDLSDDTDIFRSGCDSLQATWIRNTITRAIRDGTKTNVNVLTPDAVFANPTVLSLTHLICRTALRSFQPDDATITIEDRVQSMRRAVDNHTQNFPARPEGSTLQRPKKDVVLVTGTTGSFGAQILATLLRASHVSRVYAVNRRGRRASSLIDRQLAMFEKQNVSPTFIRSEKLVLVEADFEEEGFGLSTGVVEEIRASVTHIIHNAWRVDFSLPLSSFEGNIHALRQLVDLALSSCLSSPPALLFISSIGVLAAADQGVPILENPVAPELAIINGYSQSKLVSEMVLRRASEATSLRPTVVRLGQMCGSREISYWNATDWFPAMVKSSVELACFPDEPAIVSWIPIDTAAQFVIDALNTSTPILHLLHPRPASWNTIANTISSVMGFFLVPYHEWIAKLEAVATHGQEDEMAVSDRLPALKLLPFFRNAVWSHGAEAMGLPQADMTQALETSAALHAEHLVQITQEHVRGWVDGWNRQGFLM